MLKMMTRISDQSKPVNRKLFMHAAAMLKRYLAGSTVYEIAIEYNCSPHSVRNHLRSASGGTFAFRNRSGAKGLSKHRSEMVRLRKSGLSFKVIAAQFNCTEQTIRYHIATTADVTTRKKGKRRHQWGQLNSYRAEWTAARSDGETIASIAERYHCSAPAVAYQLQAALREATVASQGKNNKRASKN